MPHCNGRAAEQTAGPDTQPEQTAGPDTLALPPGGELSAVLEEIAPDLEEARAPAQPPGRGRPRILPRRCPWGALLLGVLEGQVGQRAIGRRIAALGLWHDRPLAIQLVQTSWGLSLGCRWAIAVVERQGHRQPTRQPPAALCDPDERPAPRRAAPGARRARRGRSGRRLAGALG